MGTIAAPLKKSAVFPAMVISMISVGEQTGGLDEMLTKIADFYGASFVRAAFMRAGRAVPLRSIPSESSEPPRGLEFTAKQELVVEMLPEPS